MTFDEYQEQARTTRLPSADTVYCIVNLAGEVGEFCSKIAKARRDGLADKDKDAYVFGLKKEIGDILWHLAALCDDLEAEGSSLEECAQINLGKLKAREKAGTLQGSGDNR